MKLKVLELIFLQSASSSDGGSAGLLTSRGVLGPRITVSNSAAIYPPFYIEKK